MEHEINQYLAQQREMAGEQVDIRKDRGRDYNWDRHRGRDRRRNRSRPSRFDDADETVLPSQQRGNYGADEDISDFREQELYQKERRLEQHSKGYEDRRLDDRLSSRYEEAKRYPRSEDRFRNRYDDRYGERHNERYEESHGERHGTHQDERRGGRRSDRHGDRLDKDDRHRESRERGSAKEKPSRTVMLKNLHSSVTDRDIRAVLQMFGAPIKDVRLVKHRDTGVSRGFAFVEFQFLPDAQRWMEENQGRIDLAGQDTQLVFSSNKDREEDWFCSQCGTHNFKRREYCFKCSISKDDSERYSEIGDVASNVLILMGLDALTTEDTVTKVLEYISSAKMCISIARDMLTHTSRGYCYVEMDTVETATHLMNILASMQPPFQIDGKQVSVHFCKQLIPEESKVTDPATTEAKWPEYDSHEGAVTTQPSSDTSTTTALYYQQATQDPSQLVESQQYAYQPYVVQHAGAGLPAQVAYQVQGALAGSNTVATATTHGTTAIPEDREQYKAAVAQEQVQAARQLQLQQQQMQQQLLATANLQEEAKKQAGAADNTAAAAAAATAAAAPEDDQEALAEKAREWSEKKKRRKEEMNREKTVEEKDEGGAAVTTTTKKKKKRKQESSGEAAAVVVPRYFQEGLKYPTPDVSKYQYDEMSGFYYDPSTGLYYDANSQYYFNSATQKYMYWDAAASTYLPAPVEKAEPEPTIAKTDTAASEKAEKPKEKDKKDKNDKNKMAKKLAKDMARWAKSMNSSKANAAKKGGAGLEGSSFVVGAADAGFAMLMKKANPADTKAAVQHVLQKQTSDSGTGSSKMGIVASYGGGSDSEPEPEIHPTSATVNPAAATNTSSTVDALTDWTKLICLLCKRQFPSKEILVKHQQFSELHKQNLESLKQDSQELGEQETGDYQYRDRAKERRQKFGVEEPPPKKKFRPPKAPIPYEEPTKEGLKEDNIGNKMLQKMGWNKGTGLGKKQQGRTDPIEVQKRQVGAGLGIKGGTYDITAMDTYRDAVKKVMRNRFEEME